MGLELSSDCPVSPASIGMKDESKRQYATSEVNFDLRKLKQISDVLISEQEEAIGLINNFEHGNDKQWQDHDYGLSNHHNSNDVSHHLPKTPFNQHLKKLHTFKFQPHNLS